MSADFALLNTLLCFDWTTFYVSKVVQSKYNNVFNNVNSADFTLLNTLFILTERLFTLVLQT